MSNPLDPIWDAYLTSTNALKVVRRCVKLGQSYADIPLQNTRFFKSNPNNCESLLTSAQKQLDDQTVMSLYSVFEAAIRDNLARQANLLKQANVPNPEFGKGLAKMYEEHCGESRMDDVEKLFSKAVGNELLSKAGSIRTYRHWIAHGRRWEQPSTSAPPPQFAYEALTQFLQRCGLA